MIWWLSSVALAMDPASGCSERVSAEDASMTLDRVDVAIRETNLPRVESGLEEAERQLRCLDEVVTPTQLVRYAQHKAVLHYLYEEMEDATAWGRLATHLVPKQPWPEFIGSDHPLRKELDGVAAPDTTQISGFGWPGAGATFVNGSPLMSGKIWTTPGLAQVANGSGKVVQSEWVSDGTLSKSLLGGNQPDRPSWYTAQNNKSAIAALEERWANPPDPEPSGPTVEGRCSPMDEGTFRDYVASAQEAISNDDIAGHGAVFKELKQQLPCMEVQIPKDAWAEFLVGLAVVEHAMGQDWEQPLSTAVGVHPFVKRDYGPDAIKNWIPTDDLGDYEDLPTDATYFLDGQLITEAKPLDGVHIVQQYKNDLWQTRLLRDEPFPEDWLIQFDDEKGGGDAATWGTVSLVAGFGSASQSLDNPNTYVPEVSDAGALLGLVSFGAVGITGPVGVYWDATIPFQLGSGLGTDVYAGASIDVGPLAIWPGFGVTSATVTEETGSRMVVLPQPHLGVRAGVPVGGMTLDLGASGGGTPSAIHVNGRAGILGGEGLSWNAGLEFGYTSAFFVEDTDVYDVGTGRLRAGLRGGLAF